MSVSPLATRILARVPRRALTDPQAELLASYCKLLAHWNRSTNLTALTLEAFPDRTLDLLIAEPLAASELVRPDSANWLDFGSGGGSPAIPIKVARARLELTMVESRSRKAAFLREAVRTLDLPRTAVWLGRIEELGSAAGSADLVTIRAVRIGPAILRTAAAVLKPGGRFVIFGRRQAPALGDAPFSPGSVVDSPINGSRIHSFIRQS